MGKLLTEISKILSGTTSNSGISSLNVYNFIDESGNVEQIEKKSKERLHYYIDPEIPLGESVQTCAIGANSPVNGDCSDGIGLGFGDNYFGYAKWES